MITSGSCPHPHLPHHGVSPRRLAEANDYAEALGTWRRRGTDPCCVTAGARAEQTRLSALPNSVAEKDATGTPEPQARARRIDPRSRTRSVTASVLRVRAGLERFLHLP
jgi:hypothetical protein